MQKIILIVGLFLSATFFTSSVAQAADPYAYKYIECPFVEFWMPGLEKSPHKFIAKGDAYKNFSGYKFPKHAQKEGLECNRRNSDAVYENYIKIVFPYVKKTGARANMFSLIACTDDGGAYVIEKRLRVKKSYPYILSKKNYTTRKSIIKKWCK